MTLEHLDTFIAFAVVMLGVSLLVTIFTQMVSSLFGLRGTNLKWGLTQLFKTLHPALGNRVEQIADWILTHPLISDSTLSRLGHGGVVPAAFPPVRRALRRFLSWMSLPGRWRLASTIRLEELLGILRSYGVAPAGGAAPATPAEVMHAIATGAGGVGPEVQALTAQVSSLAAGLPAAIPAGLLGGVRIDQLVQKLPATAEAELTSLKTYFNVVMDRAAQRFTLHARVWTVVFSILVAFALHLDAFRLLSQISSDAEMRAALVSSSKALVEKAAAIQPQAPAAPPAASKQQTASGQPAPAPATAPQAQEGPSKSGPCAEPLHVPATYMCAMTKIEDPKVKNALTLPGAPAAFLSREDAVAWLQKTMEGDSNSERVVTLYETAVDGLLGDADRLL
ncbi:MAG TPA: hypothetical protein VEU62_19100, partial [Bryobacterales bacterium]|nr:hypothetical protein [Bryobacterales bacterium]